MALNPTVHKPFGRLADRRQRTLTFYLALDKLPLQPSWLTVLTELMSTSDTDSISVVIDNP